MASNNSVILYGNITGDPELRHTPKGTAVVSFSVAVNRRWKGDDGEPREETTFLECRAWANQAEAVAKHWHKGDPILLEGRLQQEKWETESGEKRQKIVIILEHFSFTHGRKEAEGK